MKHDRPHNHCVCERVGRGKGSLLPSYWDGTKHPIFFAPETPGRAEITVKTPVETFLNPYQTNKLDNEIISIKLFTLVSFVED